MLKYMNVIETRRITLEITIGLHLQNLLKNSSKSSGLRLCSEKGTTSGSGTMP